MSPMFPRMQDSGAAFGEIMGYERPLWFEEKPVLEVIGKGRLFVCLFFVTSVALYWYLGKGSLFHKVYKKWSLLAVYYFTPLNFEVFLIGSSHIRQ